MKKCTNISALIAVMALGSLYSMPIAFAIPSLQLNIVGGTYDTASQTVFAGSDPFTLQAYLIPDADALLTDNYFISASVYPAVSTPTNLGSFDFNSTQIDVTDDMVYGTAPIDAYAQNWDAGDLSKHGIFPTYYKQFGFTFDEFTYSQAFNSQDSAGTDASTLTYVSGDEMHYKQFSVDTSNLLSGYYIHFDLYSTTTGKAAVNDTDIKSFAPFSHDAQSSTANDHVDPPVVIPEPTTLALLGLGLLGFSVARKQKK